MYSILRRSVIVALLFLTYSASSQVYNPLKWKYSQKQISDSEYAVTIHVDIEKGWHTYSQYTDSNGPTPMAFTYTPAPDYKLEGKTMEDSCITKFDSTFKVVVKYFVGQANFTQKIIVHSPKGFTLKGNVYCQVCNEGMCLPPKAFDFAIAIPPTAPAKQAASGYLWLWLLGFLGGLAALFTPCVFPMVPLTVSFFTKQASTSKKTSAGPYIYAVCIILIYVIFGALITAIAGPSGLNAIASNGWVNLIFFIIFIIFGFSFLGAFEITLPSSWVNKTDSASERGGLLGIFFMALTLCLVSFSCTAPIVGSLLAGASLSGAYWSLITGMFGFSTALALPFAIFAAVPNLMKNLPKSGGWLNSVKVVLGLLEIAFSLKFLSNTDLVGLHIKWLHFHIDGPMGILKREIFIAIWIVMFAIIGLYLLGKLKFHHDSDLKYLGVGRLFLAVIAFAFSLYLIPGLFGAPLKLIGGFPPPSYYAEGWSIASSQGVKSSGTDAAKDVAKNSNQRIGCPLNLNCFHDYDEAVAAAKQFNKPILIDFTGFSCFNCRKMEENVWSDPGVLNIISNDYILVSLYVDDKMELPEAQQFVSKIDGSKVETLGEKWSDMETTLYKSNAQPLYVLVDAMGNELTPKRGYTPDVEQYKQFLEEGKNNFKAHAANTGNNTPIFKSSSSVSLN